MAESSPKGYKRRYCLLQAISPFQKTDNADMSKQGPDLERVSLWPLHLRVVETLYCVSNNEKIRLCT